MASSGVRDTTSSVATIITDALKQLQIGVGGETLAAEYLAAGISTLNMMIRAWAVKGIRLWLNETQIITFVNGQATYTLTPRVLELYEASRRDAAGPNDTPIRPYSREEYERVPNKAVIGAPFVVYVDRQRITTTATFYPVPGAAEIANAMTGRLVVKRQIEDVTAGPQDVEFPPEWIAALIYNLAVWIAPSFNKEANPTVKELAAMTYGDLEGQDRETSVFMQPNRRG